jgi:flagellar motor switch protein FliN/FliY
MRWDDDMDELMRNALGRHADALDGVASVVREQALTGLESLTTARPSLSDISLGTAEAASLEAEFAEIPHVAIDLALTAASGRFAAAMLMPLVDLGGLLSIETGEDRMADADFANAQLQVISGAAREYFDLLGLTLFQDQLSGIEIVPASARVGDAPTTVGLVYGGASGEVVRIDVGMSLPTGEPVGVTLLLPQAFLDVVGGMLGGDVSADRAPAPLRPAAAAAGGAPEVAGPFGLSSEPVADLPAADNVSPFRAAGTFGSGSHEDVDVHPVRFPPLSEPARMSSERRALELIMDVSMRVTVELGRASLTVEDVLGLGPGSVVELNKLAGEPVDVMVNEQLIARGEVVVVDENFGVRVTEIVSPRRRAQAMGA